MTGPDDVSPTSRLVLVFTAATIPEGLLAKGLLESEGIPVVVKGESQGPYRFGPMDLWVPESFEVRARTILETARSSGLQPDSPDAAQPDR